MGQRFRKPNYKELKKIEQRIHFLNQAATYFKNYFIGKKVVYCTQTNELAIHFSESNFMHLCGLSYSKGTEKFFLDCLDNQLDLASLQIKGDGTTMQKLQMISAVTELTSPHVRLIGSGKYLYLAFDYALRTNKQILALTLKNAQKKIVPQSLLDLKKMKNFAKGEEVTRIYALHYISNEKTIYYDKNLK